MDEFLDDMDDEQVDDLLMPEEDETSSSQMYEHFRFVADKGQSLLRVDKFLVDRMMGATRNRIQLAAEAGASVLLWQEQLAKSTIGSFISKELTPFGKVTIEGNILNAVFDASLSPFFAVR